MNISKSLSIHLIDCRDRGEHDGEHDLRVRGVGHLGDDGAGAGAGAGHGGGARGVGAAAGQAQAPDGEEEEAGDEAAEAGADLREGLLQQLTECR